MTEPAASLDFRALFQALPGAYLVIDRDYTIVAASDLYLTATGGRREQLMGRDLFSLLPETLSAEAKAAFAALRASFDRVLAAGEAETLPAQPFAIRRPKAEGGGLREGFLSVLNTPLRDADGRVGWIIHRVLDVTESQSTIRRLDRAEEAHRALERRHDLALAASGMGAWDYDGVERRLEFDARGRQLLGLSPETPFTFEAFLGRVHPDDRERVREASAAMLDPAGPGLLDLTYRLAEAEGQVPAWREARGRATFVDGACVRVVGIVLDVSETMRHEAHLRLLINELNHRVKNTLAVIQSIAMRTLHDGASVGEARARFMDRLMALAAAHDVLTRENWEGADLATVVERALAPHEAERGARFDVAGPPMRVAPKVALSLALALHELATNAVKYGGLSTAQGRVKVAWSLEGAEPELRFDWAEHGGPPVSAPTRQGFGLRLLERVLAEDIGGSVELGFAPSGLTCAIAAPAAAWRASEGSALSV